VQKQIEEANLLGKESKEERKRAGVEANRAKEMQPDWMVAVWKQLKDQGVAPRSRIGRSAMQKARTASMSDEEKAEVAAKKADWYQKRKPRT
jgi:hypothetical protein